MYITNSKQLFKSVVEFFEKPELWRQVLGSNAKYFVHTKKGSKDYFAMSKFCVLKDVTVEDYISDYRYETDGNNSQKKITKALKEVWVPRSKINPEIRKAFDNWIGDFFPNYSVEKASFISIATDVKYKKKKAISPETLEEILAKQREIGKVGELIAYKHELQRLKKLGVKNPEKYIVHVSQENSSAGYDIISTFLNEERFIEVKSSTTNDETFYISQNEIEVLTKYGNKSFLYSVRINDLKQKIGFVEHEIKDPVRKLSLTPILFEAILKS